MPKEENRDTFRVAKVTRIHPESQHHYGHNTTRPLTTESVDEYALEYVSSEDTRSSVSSEFSVRPESPPIEIIRLPPPVNNRSRLTIHPQDASSSIITTKQIALPPSSFRSYIVSPSSPLFRKVSWLPSKSILTNDEITPKPTADKKSQAPESKVKPIHILISFLALAVAIAICIIIVLAVFLAATDNEPYMTSNSLTSSACATNCMMSLTPFLASTIASWPFDGSLSDVNNVYYASYTDPPTVPYVTGNIGQAVSLDGVNYVYASTQFMNLSYQSWTIEGWILINNVVGERGVFGQCQSSSTTDQCLSLSIKNGRLHLGFMNDDLDGSTLLTAPSTVWHHIAFIYDYTLMQQSMYLDGILEATTRTSGIAVGPYKGTSGQVTIGSTNDSNYFIGYIDQLQVSSGAKTACQILNDATLTAYYAFDVGTSYLDSSINVLHGTASLLISLPGRVNQAYSFQSEYSYFQSLAFTAYSSNEPFSVSLWVKPFYINGGTLIHLSLNSDGSTAVCFDLLGFSSSGQLIGQVYTASPGTTNIGGPTMVVNIWTHIVLTYSSANGLALYTNGTLQGVINSLPSFPSTTYIVPPYMTVGNPRTTGSIPVCTGGTPSLSPAAYRGLIDELRIYSRQITTTEICSLFNP